MNVSKKAQAPARVQVQAPAALPVVNAFHYAGEIVKAPGVPDDTKDLIASMCHDLMKALMKLEKAEMSAEARQRAEAVISLTFMTARTIGQTEQALHARRDMPRARVEMAQEGRKESIKGVAARHKELQEIIAQLPQPLNKAKLVQLLIRMQGDPRSKKKRAALRHKIYRDLNDIRPKIFFDITR